MATDPTRMLLENLFATQGLANGLSLEVRALIEELFAEIVAELRRMDPTELASAVAQRTRVQRLLAEVGEAAGAMSDDVFELVHGRLAAIGAQQSRFAANLLTRSIGPIEAAIEPGTIGVPLWRKILSTDPVHGELLRDWADGLGARAADGFRREVQLGMSRGATLDEMVRAVRGRSDGNGGYVGGVMNTTTRHAEATIRTAVNDISNQALMDTWTENEDVIDGYTVIATLDSRTCLVCAPQDGKSYDLDDQRGRPPFHVGCRCVTTPRIAWKRLGVKPPDEGTRASEDGPVPASMDFEGWLSEQDSATQDKILGPSRADLFRSGKVDLGDLVRSDGRIVTLDELS